MNQNTGAPSSLLVDCGQVTLTGAAAYRDLAQSFTPDYLGWHFLAFHSNQAVNVRRMSQILDFTAAGYFNALGIGGAFGQADIADGTVPGTGGYYVDTAYGALAATAVQPTAATNNVPYLAPYRT